MEWWDELLADAAASAAAYEERGWETLQLHTADVTPLDGEYGDRVGLSVLVPDDEFDDLQSLFADATVDGYEVYRTVVTDYVALLVVLEDGEGGTAVLVPAYYAIADDAVDGLFDAADDDGASDGPGGAFPGSGDGATGNVSVAPFYADAALTTLSEFDTALEANFTVKPPVPTAGENATFDATNASNNATVAGYEWRFGDGSNATGERATHSYDDPGNYTVGLTVTGPNGTTANASSEVVVAAANATNATLRTDSEAANTTANLTFSGSDAAATIDGTVERYEWSFGDGTTATGVSPTHTYDDPGTYTVTLTMVTADSGVETVADSVTVAGDRNETGAGNGTSVVERGSDPVYQTGRVTEAPETVSAGETVTVTGSVEAQISDARNNVVFGVVGLSDGTVLGVSGMGTTGSGTVSTTVDVPSDADGQQLVWTFVPVLTAETARDSFTREADKNHYTKGDLGIVVATVGGSGSGPDDGGNETLDAPEGVNRTDFESVAGSDDSVGRSDVLGTVRAYIEGDEFRGASLSRSEILSVVRYYIRN